MKLSLSWIFDHIVGSWQDVDIDALIQSFNTTTAEIDDVRKVSVSLRDMTLIRVIKVEDGCIHAVSPERDEEITLPERSDVVRGNIYAVKHQDDQWVWATSLDWGGQKEVLLPAFSCSEHALSGAWKDEFEVEDYIITLDNTSLTHRPDLWGHRGVAREIAALLNLPLKPLDMMLADLPVCQYESSASATSSNPFSSEIKNPEACSRFAGLYINNLPYTQSWLWMAHRLVRVDSKPIDAVVDATNYVMFDISQPLHAFDADKIPTKIVRPEMAQAGQTVTLLDGREVALVPDDIVISDGKKPIALAGVMGGKETAVSSQTTRLFVESACFDPVHIRKTSTRVKERTEASSRFEKSLDPNQNTQALLRFVQLLREYGPMFTISDEIMSLGRPTGPVGLTISHAHIEKRLGVSIEPIFVKKTLEVLDFTVEERSGDDGVEYAITIPTFRSTKDIGIAEDIVEEVGRFYGFDNIPLKLPEMALKSYDIHPIDARRAIKEFMVTAARCHEVQNYAVFDEQFLEEIAWQPERAVRIKNPVSENWQYLVTSLVPHLLKAVTLNNTEDELRFFELNRVWRLMENDTIVERKSLAGIFYKRKEAVDFYQEKEILTSLSSWLTIPLEWKKADFVPAWYHPHKTAAIMVHGRHIGYAGVLHPGFCPHAVEGDAFIFELDGDVLTTHKPDPIAYEPTPKYPDTSRDVSMMVSVEVSVDDILKTVIDSDARIFDVQLVDFFQKEDWKDQRSVTIRFYAGDPEATLKHDEIEKLYESVRSNLQQHLRVQLR